MSEQRPPGDNDGSRTAQRRRRAAWRFRRRQNAIQAATEHDARVTALIARAVQQQVDQEGFLPSAERDARVATLTVGVVHARLAQQSSRRNRLARGGRAWGRGRGRGDMRAGRGGRGRGTDPGRGRGAYSAPENGHDGHGSEGVRDRGRGATQGAEVNPAGQQNRFSQHEVQVPAPSRGPQWWTTPQTLREMADAGFPAGRAGSAP